MVERLKISQDNTRNHLKRRRILWEAWDELFQVLHACTKRHAPLLHTMMWESCNIRATGVLGGHFMMAHSHGAYYSLASTPPNGR